MTGCEHTSGTSELYLLIMQDTVFPLIDINNWHFLGRETYMRQFTYIAALQDPRFFNAVLFSVLPKWNLQTSELVLVTTSQCKDGLLAMRLYLFFY